MNIAKKLKQRAGFTLVELCVVMAVTAIVGTMIVSSMIFMSNQQSEITKEAKRIEEITEVQKTVNGWLKKYDSENYIITTSGNSSLVAKTTANTNVGEISFGNKKITVDNVATAKEFENITSVAFYVLDGKNAIKATVRYGENETQDLIFSMFSNTTRNRRVENRS